MALRHALSVCGAAAVTERVLSFEQALGEVLRYAAGMTAPRVLERVALIEADGRVLAATVRAERDQPPFDRSTRDGYAVSRLGC